MKAHYNFCVIGGGFYGCCLALWLRAQAGSVLLLEKEPTLLSRASAINQARVHTGFHYPRSLTTALRSLANMPRFVLEFKKAIVDDFTMLYAIASKGSKINAQRFWRMYKAMKAPIESAAANQRALFASNAVEDVFAVQEYAFDHSILRKIMAQRLEAAGVDICCNTEAFSCAKHDACTLVQTNKGSVTTDHLFNCTYSRINFFLEASGEPLLALKHELTEMALVEPPESLRGLAVTVMDGAFFSLMPYPSRYAYSLSHVRYTPHMYWQDVSPCADAHKVLLEQLPDSAFPLMEHDVRRFMPNFAMTYRESIFEVKTLLTRNEADDGRPILYKAHPALGDVHTVMGSKLDNVYDLFEGMNTITAPFTESTLLWRRLLGV